MFNYLITNPQLPTLLQTASIGLLTIQISFAVATLLNLKTYDG